jgi:transcriptional regulator with XRE-family HTH domain
MPYTSRLQLTRHFREEGGYVATVGERLKEERLLRGWSQRDLAREAGTTAETISSIETGQHEPRPSTLRKLAEGLGLEVRDFYKEPAVPLAEAPREAGQPEASTKTVEEFERALAHVLEPVRMEALREQQAANRTRSSEGRPQTRIVDPPEGQAGNRFLNEFSPDERPLAFGELALGYARYERDNKDLQEALTRGRDLLRERDEKIAQVEQENTRLKEENTQLREEAGQESAHR